MNTKIKLSVLVVFITLFGLLAAAKPASAMTCDSATIYSTVSTYSTPVRAYFTYATNFNQAALGEGVTTPPQEIAPGSYITQLLTGLSPSTTYYYRLVVPGQAEGTNVNNFTTPACTTPPVTQTCQDTSATNYGGSLPCRYQAQTCQDSSAINYGSSLPCRYQNYQQPSVTISADQTSLYSGGSTVIRWYPVNATSCYGSNGSNGWATSQSNYSSSFNTGSLYSTTTYTISCSNYNGGSASNSVTVYVQGQNYYPTYPTYQQNNSLSVITTNATQVLNTSAQLNSLIGSSGNSQVNTWYEWGRTINLGNVTTTAPVGSLPSVIHRDTLSGLNPGTTYYFRAVAQNSYFKTNGSILSFTTGGEQSITVVNQYVHKKNPSALVLITSSVNSNQPMVTIDNSRPHPGDEINLTVNYQNAGNADVTSAVLQISLPQGVNYVSSSDNPNVFGNALTFKLGTLKANSQGVATVKTRVEDNIAPGTVLNFPAVLNYVNPSGQTESVNANVSAQVWNQDGSLGAFAFGAGFFPTSIFGWLLLIVLILLLVYLAKYLYEKSGYSTVHRQPSMQIAGRKTTTTTIDHEPTGKKTTTTTIEE